jgi:hypothetical protein
MLGHRLGIFCITRINHSHRKHLAEHNTFRRYAKHRVAIMRNAPATLADRLPVVPVRSVVAELANAPSTPILTKSRIAARVYEIPLLAIKPVDTSLTGCQG